MTLKEFASLLDGREYRCEITPSEEALAKELGFVVVFGYSDDNAELRGAIDDEIGCFDGGILEHQDLPDTIYADWCPEDIDCAWAYGTSIPHEKFYIYDHGELYCVGIVCDINKPKQTNADHLLEAISTEDGLAKFLMKVHNEGIYIPFCQNWEECWDLIDENGVPDEKCMECMRQWLRKPYEGD